MSMSTLAIFSLSVIPEPSPATPVDTDEQAPLRDMAVDVDETQTEVSSGRRPSVDRETGDVPNVESQSAQPSHGRVLAAVEEGFGVEGHDGRFGVTMGFLSKLRYQVDVDQDRGPVNDTFRLDRDLGATVSGQPWKGRSEYVLSVHNGEGLNQSRLNPSMLYIARVAVSPLGTVHDDQTPAITSKSSMPLRFSIEANAYTKEIDQPLTAVDPATGDTMDTTERVREWGAGAGFSPHWDRFYALTEGDWRHRVLGDRSKE